MKATLVSFFLVVLFSVAFCQWHENRPAVRWEKKPLVLVGPYVDSALVDSAFRLWEFDAEVTRNYSEKGIDVAVFLTMSMGDDSLGSSLVYYDSLIINKAYVRIVVKTIVEGTFFQTLLHEIGHVIGLGHSNSVFDVMYKQYFFSISKPSHNDLSRLRSLYKK